MTPKSMYAAALASLEALLIPLARSRIYQGECEVLYDSLRDGADQEAPGLCRGEPADAGQIYNWR